MFDWRKIFRRTKAAAERLDIEVNVDAERAFTSFEALKAKAVEIDAIFSALQEKTNGSLAHLKLGRGDILVLQPNSPITGEQAAQLSQQWTDRLPRGVKLFIIEKGASLTKVAMPQKRKRRA